MVVEGAFGHLKVRRRVLLRRNDCKHDTVKIMSLACCVLHNICIDMNDKANPAWDNSYDRKAKRRLPREEVQNILNLTKCRWVADTNKYATKIRDCLTERFWDEKQGYCVN